MKKLDITTLGLGLILGCASITRPPALESLNGRMDEAQVRVLEADRPDLVAQARALLDESERHYEDGDTTKSDLAARTGHAKLDSAADLAARDTAVASLAVLEQTDRSLMEREAHLTKQKEELLRMQALNAQVHQLESQLAHIHDSEKSMAGQAKRAILAARAKQAEAIRAGAPTRAADAYAQGRLLVDSALESMRLELFSEANDTAIQASQIFDASMTMAAADMAAGAERATAAAETAAVERQRLADRQKQNSSARNEAEDAIGRAEAAERNALSRRMPTTNPPMYASAVRILRTAESALDRGDFVRALEKANEAVARFETASAPPVADVAPTGAPIEAVSVALGAASEPAVPTKVVDRTARPQPENRALAAQVDERIVALQVLRARSLGRRLDERCPAAFREIDALLKLATQLNKSGNTTRAFELTVLAQETFDRCGATDAPASTVGVQLTAIAPTSPKPDDGREAAERAVEAAQMALAESTVQLGNVVTQNASELVGRAERWLERSAYDRATRVANQAVEQLGRTKAKKDQEAAALQGRADAKSEAERSALAKRRKAAEDSIQKAEVALAQARVSVEGTALEQPQALLASAIRWLGTNDFARAEEMAKKATTAIAAAKLGRTTMKKTVEADAPSPTDTTVADQANSAAEERLASAQIRLARARAERPTDASVREASALVDSAVSWLERGAPNRAEVMADRAVRVLDARPVGTSSGAIDASNVRTVSTIGPTAPAVAGKSVVVAVNDDTKRDELRTRMIDAAILLERSREEARTPAAERRRDRGERFLERANEALGKNDVLTADRYSLAATSELEGSLSVAEPIEPTEPAVASQVKQVSIVADAPTNEEPAPKTNGHIGQSDRPSKVIVRTAGQTESTAFEDPMVRSAYDSVMEALILRDRVRMRVGDAQQPRIELGTSFMTRAREAWSAKRYMAAQRLAIAASEEFRGAQEDDAKALALMERSKREAEEARRRSLADAEEAKARETAASQRDAKERTDEAARARTVAAEAERTSASREAEDAIRRADVAAAVCERTRCEKRDFASTVKAKSDLGAARVAVERGNFKRATALATDATATFTKAAEVDSIEILVPAAVKSVAVEGTMLVLTPRITFESGNTRMTRESDVVLDGLHTTIESNRDAIARIRIVGHTDDRGSHSQNVRISKARAQAVLDALAARGVARDLMVAEGMGPDRPLVENNTPQGRETNRRVEIHYELTR